MALPIGVVRPRPHGVPHAVLSFSTLEPPTHILLALSVQEPMHLGALAAAVTTGHVDARAARLPGSYARGRRAVGHGKGAPFVQVQIDAERVRAFLADPDSARRQAAPVLACQTSPVCLQAFFFPSQSTVYPLGCLPHAALYRPDHEDEWPSLLRLRHHPAYDLRSDVRRARRLGTLGLASRAHLPQPYARPAASA